LIAIAQTMKQFLLLFISGLILTIGLAVFSASQVMSQQSNPDIPQQSEVIFSPDRSQFSSDRQYYYNSTIDPDIALNNKQNSTNITDTVDSERFQQIIEYAKNNNLSQQPLGEIISAIGNQFIGAKYQAGLLDKTPKETLFVSLQNFDCLLLVETVLALAKNIYQQDYNYRSFTAQIQNERYRDGKLNNYCSRLHYFSEWIEDNQRRGNVINITPKLGGITLPKKLNYMSNHWDKYPATVRTSENYRCIVQMEAKLAGIDINYIPQKDIDKISPQLQTGDIIGIATNIDGLDVTHTGFVDRNDQNKLGFLHASPAGKVTIAPNLQTYVGRVKNAIGIVVVRAIK
jgi:Protein of unknown function (DUF1460)